MEVVRYYLALILVVVFPPALLSWFVIHPLARYWRRWGPTVTYLVVVSVALPLGVALYRLRGPLLRVEYGFDWRLALVGAISLVIASVLEHAYRRHLEVSTLLGLPEVSQRRESRLLTDGIYARIRHPRYVGLFFEIAGLALIANYLATYVLVVSAFPVLYFVVLLEERELVQRFGAEYEDYMRRVPRFVPNRWRSRES